MLTNVEILSMEPIMTESLWYFIITVSIVIITGILVAIYDSKKFIKGEDKAAFKMLITWILFIITWLIISVTVLHNIFLVPTDRNRYEVIIGNSVTFNEFTNKYKLIENKDNIWVVEDK